MKSVRFGVVLMGCFGLLEGGCVKQSDASTRPPMNESQPEPGDRRARIQADTTSEQKTSSGNATPKSEVPPEAADAWASLQIKWERLARSLGESTAPRNAAIRSLKLCLDAEKLRGEVSSMARTLDGFQREVCGSAVERLPACWHETAGEFGQSHRRIYCGDDLQKWSLVIAIASRVGVGASKVSLAKTAIAGDIQEAGDQAELANVKKDNDRCAVVRRLGVMVEKIPPQERASLAPLIQTSNMKELRTVGMRMGWPHRKDSEFTTVWDFARFRMGLYNDAVKLESQAKRDKKPEAAKEAAGFFECVGDFKDAPTRAVAAHRAEAQIAAAIAEEKRCNADPKCVAQRVAWEICGLMEQRRQTQVNIADENRYSRRAGVVNLTELQELKENLRLWDEQIADRKALYREMTGRNFSRRSCSQ